MSSSVDQNNDNVNGTTAAIPAWLEEPIDNTPLSQNIPQTPKAKVDLGEMPFAWFMMRISNPIVALLLISCVLVKLSDLSFFEKFDAWVMCIYILVFAWIILSFECFGTMKCYAHVLAKNFGFMYTIYGRLLFMIMAGVIVCSLGNTFSYVVCGLVIANAGFNALVMALHPRWTFQMMKEHPSAASGMQSSSD